MTPLAYRIAKQSGLPLKRREPFNDEGGLLHKMEDIHCFEVTDVLELVKELGDKWLDKNIDTENVGIDKTFAFLPAPKTWIEWLVQSANGSIRSGVLLEEYQGDEPEYEGTALGTLAMWTHGGEAMGSFERKMLFPLHNAKEFDWRVPDTGNEDMDEFFIRLLHTVYASLALINSPRVIGRRQHAAHKNLKKFAVGKFPLHAWTEIKLEVNKPVEVKFGGEPRQTWISGRAALHFCRAYVRIVRGQLQYVSAYWSGDPAIGVKRTRYRVIKNKQPRSDAGGTANA
jgi:hypothetical protein